MTALSCENLRHGVQETEILRGIDCALSPGALTGLVGPNGAGKSTLVRLLAGIDRPDGGVVRLGERAVLSLPARQRARTVAYLPQGHLVHWPLEVYELVALGRLPHRGTFGSRDAADRAAIERAMETAEVGYLRDRPVGTLSGGERARVMLARALAVEAPVLLVDEPIASLDPYHQLKVMSLLQSIAESGRLVLVVLHDLSLAARFCKRLLLLDQGKLVADGVPGAVLSRPRLAETYGVQALYGAHEGEGFVLPWRRVEGATQDSAADEHGGHDGEGEGACGLSRPNASSA